MLMQELGDFWGIPAQKKHIAKRWFPWTEDEESSSTITEPQQLLWKRGGVANRDE